jgi:two-component system, NarL family, nitrate/nitrite response regulator NarL
MGLPSGGLDLDRLDHFRGSEASFTHGAGSRFVGPIRRHLAVVDQSPLRRECLKLALLQQSRRWHVTDVATAIELAQLIRRGEQFEVILLGGSTCAHIDLADIALLSAAAPETPILVTAECDDAEGARVILRSGARGFLPTSHGLKVLMGALERMRVGGTYVPLSLSEPVPERMERARDTPWRELTRRQCDVLALISEGKSNKLIADALTMTESTVKAHVKQIIKRLHVANRTQAALIASRASWQSARH